MRNATLASVVVLLLLLVAGIEWFDPFVSAPSVPQGEAIARLTAESARAQREMPPRAEAVSPDQIAEVGRRWQPSPESAGPGEPGPPRSILHADAHAAGDPRREDLQRLAASPISVTPTSLASIRAGYGQAGSDRIRSEPTDVE